MNLQLQSRVVKIERGEEWSVVTLSFTGKVTDTKIITAKECYMESELKLKTAVADTLVIGSTFTAHVNDQDSPRDFS
jgi:hypothetical protein